MSVPSISCPKCSAPMPANYAWCPNCGHANAFVSQETAYVPPGPRPGAEETDAASPTGESPTGGAPTVNIGETGDAARYTPPPEASAAAGAAGAAGAAAGAAAGWQPGQYSNAPMQPTQPQQPPQGQYIQPQQYSPPPALPYGQPQQSYPYATTPPKDPTVALLLELIGYAGVLGIGHIYAGRTTRGIGLLIGWVFYAFIAFVLFFTLIFTPVACIMFLLVPVVPILSGLWIKNDLEKESRMVQR